MITGAAFVGVSAAYDTVNHRILIQPFFNTTRNRPLCRVIQNILPSMKFYVELNNECSRWWTQKHDFLYHQYYLTLYINNKHIYPGTRRLIYADDICVTAQYPSFTEVAETIEDAHNTTDLRICERTQITFKLPHSIYGTKMQDDH